MANRASAPGSSRKRCDPATRVGVQVVSHPPLSISPDSSKGERPAHARQTVEHYHVGRPFPLPLDSSKAERPADFRRTGERYLVERPFMDTSLNSISPRLSIEVKRGQHPPYPPLSVPVVKLESHVSAKDEPRVRISAGTPISKNKTRASQLATTLASGTRTAECDPPARDHFPHRDVA